jgi:hypothetical protein
MSETVLITYPSGFVGSGTVGLTHSKSTADVAKQLLGGTASAPKDDYVYSTDISNMWDEMRYGTAVTKTYLYKEKLAWLAFTHMGVKDGIRTFGTWYDAQQKGAEFGENHQRWILETLRLLVFGKARKYNYDTWAFLLTVGSNPRPSRQLALEIEDLLSQENTLGVLTNQMTTNGIGESQRVRAVGLSHLVLGWLRAPGGETDLAQSLHVLYGKR